MENISQHMMLRWSQSPTALVYVMSSQVHHVILLRHLKKFSVILSVHLSLGQEAVSSKIVSKIKNTMSDRHAAEKLFNEMLHDYRAENLPDVIGNWVELSADEKVNMTRIILIHASSSQSYSCCSLIFAVSSLSALSLVLILSLRNIFQYRLQVHHPPTLRWPMISCSVIFLS